MPSGQWLAVGTIQQSQSVYGDAPGQQLIRAWIFQRVCKKGAGCHTEFAASSANGSVWHAALLQGNDDSLLAVAPTTVGPCADGGTAQDHYDVNLSWLSENVLLATTSEWFDHETGRCTPNAYEDVEWRATPVPQTPTPTLAIRSTHAATAAAFRAAALRVCTDTNAEAIPIARRLSALELSARTASTRTARADSEARIANLLGSVLPLSIKAYAEIPQPPTGGLDNLWHQDIRAIRRQLEPAAAMMAALRNGVLDTSRYLGTGDQLARQRLLTTPSLVENDAVQMVRPGATSDTLEHRLGLPEICIDEPAIASIFNSSASQLA
jgi:hypothetical protein